MLKKIKKIAPHSRQTHRAKSNMKKRDTNPPNTTSSTLSDAALSLSNACRRTIATESIANTKKNNPPLAPKPPPQPTELLAEIKALRESLKHKENECTDFSIRMSKLSQSHMEIERRLAAANRELLIMHADQTTPPIIRHPPPTQMPISTQGKDALYWHQACRTLYRQYTEAKNELENKTDQFIRLHETYKSILKRLEEAESQHDKGNPPPEGTRRFSADCGS